MAQVSVTINGRQYRMACDDGQEDQLLRLAGDLDRSIANVRANFGEIGDMRLTVMAALLLAEELAEARSRLECVDTKIADLQQARAVADIRAEAAQATLTAAINSAAERIEQAARLLGRRGEEESTALG
jgi:cell division protein ZapA